METQFSGYDGHGLQELVRSEFDILDSNVDHFVYPEWPDDRFCGLVWEPLASLEFWQMVREYEPKAILELKKTIDDAPEFS